MGWMTWLQFPAGAGMFSLCHHAQTSFGTLPSLLSSGYWGLFPQG